MEDHLGLGGHAVKQSRSDCTQTMCVCVSVCVVLENSLIILEEKQQWPIKVALALRPKPLAICQGRF